MTSAQRHWSLVDSLNLTSPTQNLPTKAARINKLYTKRYFWYRGKPLITRETVVNLIGSTKTNKGLKIKAKLDENIYEKGKKITDEKLNAVDLEKSEFHGEWNYKIKPRKPM